MIKKGQWLALRYYIPADPNENEYSFQMIYFSTPLSSAREYKYQNDL